MNRLSDLFIQKITEFKGKPMVINDWLHFLTFDTMGDLAFGRTFGQLESGMIHPGIALITQWLGYAVYTLQVPWLMVMMQHIPGIEDPTLTLRKFSENRLRERELVNQHILTLAIFIDFVFREMRSLTVIRKRRRIQM